MKRKKVNRPRIISIDPALSPYAEDIQARIEHYRAVRKSLLGDQEITSFANGHLYFGLHREAGGWVFREHAPAAAAIHIFGDFNGWNRASHPLTRLENGEWEIHIPGEDAFRHGERYLIEITTPAGEKFDRIPAYATSAVQNRETCQFDGRVLANPPYEWHDQKRAHSCPKPLLIYECHVGMAQEDGGIGTYRAFADNVLPRIKKDGYNTVQLMAIQEHPYYASFGYQVTNPFAASSWYGEPDDLKYLIDTAHGLGLRVLLDLVHSHAASNEREGICNFDGSGSLYCSGHHPAWGSRLFTYGRHDVIHYLLSNIKFWMDEYHFDGFRFDGVTSMLYTDHALGRCFTSYADYYGGGVDFDALTYLTLATELIHAINPHAVAIAEDMSGYPGLCLPIAWGGVGFDDRLNMGVPDLWIRLIKDSREQDWDMFNLWYELTTRRPHEKTIGYSESHDQALVGDKTLLFRLLDAEMYTGMDRAYHSPSMDRGIALIKLIRLITLLAACDGYLNFMGNEFGHPEWIDFPREGNGWSGRYARRQWSLAENGYLKYSQLGLFDRDMLALARKYRVLSDPAARSLWIDQTRKLIVFTRGGLLFAFNFGPERALLSLPMDGMERGDYELLLSTDSGQYGGFERINAPFSIDEGGLLRGELPERTAVALKPAKKA